jgi:hypothetical protein
MDGSDIQMLSGGNIEIDGDNVSGKNYLKAHNGAEIIVSGDKSDIVVENGADIVVADSGNIYMTNGAMGWQANGSFTPPMKTQQTIDELIISGITEGMMWWNTTYHVMQCWDSGQIRNFW